MLELDAGITLIEGMYKIPPQFNTSDSMKYE